MTIRFVDSFGAQNNIKTNSFCAQNESTKRIPAREVQFVLCAPIGGRTKRIESVPRVPRENARQHPPTFATRCVAFGKVANNANSQNKRNVGQTNAVVWLPKTSAKSAGTPPPS